MEIYLCPHQHGNKIHTGTSHKVVGKFNNMANFQIAIIGQASGVDEKIPVESKAIVLTKSILS